MEEPLPSAVSGLPQETSAAKSSDAPIRFEVGDAPQLGNHGLQGPKPAATAANLDHASLPSTQHETSAHRAEEAYDDRRQCYLERVRDMDLSDPCDRAFLHMPWTKLGTLKVCLFEDPDGVRYILQPKFTHLPRVSTSKPPGAGNYQPDMYWLCPSQRREGVPTWVVPAGQISIAVAGQALRYTGFEVVVDGETEAAWVLFDHEAARSYKAFLEIQNGQRRFADDQDIEDFVVDLVDPGQLFSGLLAGGEGEGLVFDAARIIASYRQLAKGIAWAHVTDMIQTSRCKILPEIQQAYEAAPTSESGAPVIPDEMG